VKRKSTPIPEPVAQLQRQLDQFRSNQPQRTKLPEPLWLAAVELARQHGVYSVAHPLRLDYTGLKKRLGGALTRQRKAKPAFVELIGPNRAQLEECVIDFESSGGSKMRIQWKTAAPPDRKPAAGLARCREMIQITAQMRVLVAIEPVDGRKGIDSLARLCQEKLAEDPFFGIACSCFGAVAGPRSGCSAMTARDTGLHRNDSRRGGSCGGRKPSERPNHWKHMRHSCCWQRATFRGCGPR